MNALHILRKHDVVALAHRAARISRQAIALATIAIAAFAVPAQHAAGQDFPTRPIRLITPFTAGGAADVVARIVTERMSTLLGQPVVIDTRAGAGGAIAMEAAASASPDGYTLAFTSSSTIIVVPLMRSELTYPRRLTAVGRIGNVPLVFVARSGLEANSVADLVALAKTRPGRVSVGSSGTGGLAHMTGEGFKAAAGIDLLHVPYKGDAQEIAALMGGELDTAFVAVASAIAVINAGKLKGLAIAGSRRAPQMPNVPTFAEAGYPESSIDTSFGLLAPANTPRAVVEKLSSALLATVAQADVQDRMRQLQVVPAGAGPDEYAQAIRMEREHWTKIVARLDLKDAQR